LVDARREAEVVAEARLEDLGSGLAPVTDGWFVVNVRDAAWETNDVSGAVCSFEGESASFSDLGINIRVLRPGRTKWLYHTEPTQEDFLVLAGECLLLVEGQERPLKAWDFVHSPHGTEHAFVATGDDPCIILMAGAPRSSGVGVYPRSEPALRHGVGVERETQSSKDAQSQLGIPAWRLGRPDNWNALPWA
jgi:uncharacterized cupin superfamily protein